MSRAGRPPRYTKELAARIVEHVADGCSKDDAALAVGIHPSTLYEWQAKKPEFAEDLTRARDSLKPTLVRVVKRAALEDGRLALEYLSRIYPAEFGRKSNVTVEGNAEKPIDVRVSLAEETAEIARKLAGMTTDELRAFRSKKIASA